MQFAVAQFANPALVSSNRHVGQMPLVLNHPVNALLKGNVLPAISVFMQWFHISFIRTQK